LARAIWPCFQLFPASKQTGGLAAAAWPCTRLLLTLKS
jgi:hypothetical protein